MTEVHSCRHSQSNASKEQANVYGITSAIDKASALFHTSSSGYRMLWRFTEQNVVEVYSAVHWIALMLTKYLSCVTIHFQDVELERVLVCIFLGTTAS